MKRPYYLFSNGRLQRRHNTLSFVKASDERTWGAEAEDTGEPTGTLTSNRATIPVEQVDALYLFGEVDINTKLVTFLGQQHIPMYFFDYYGNYTASLYPREYLLSGKLKVKQVQHYLSTKKRLALARAFVDAALYNIGRVLKYYVPRLEGKAARQVHEAEQHIGHQRLVLDEVADVQELMGVEGHCRERRPPSNALNALISFGNALCYSVVLRQIYRTALDPTISYLHEPGVRRFSLALDLAEVFKPLLVDRAIFRLIKNGQLAPKHFEPRLGGTYLKDAGRKVFVGHWDERLRKTVMHRRLEKKVSYERLVRLECHKLTRHLFDPKNDPYEGFNMWW
ncbi:MAG: type I-B CRISPR-associated endonuclease Cas1b [Rhodothermales bacterium]